MEILNSSETEVLAVSVDSHWSHKAFAKELSLNYNILSDFDKEVSKKYGVLREEGFSERAYFIIDKNRIVRFKKIMDNPGIKLNNEELIQEINKISG